MLEEPVNVGIGLLTLLGIHAYRSKLTNSVLASLDQREPKGTEHDDPEQHEGAERHHERILRLESIRAVSAQ